MLGACCSGLIGIKVLSLPMFRYVLMFLSRLPSPFRLLSPRLPGFPAILGFVDYHLLIVFKVVCCIKAWEGSMPGKAQCCMRTLSAWEGLNSFNVSRCCNHSPYRIPLKGSHRWRGVGLQPLPWGQRAACSNKCRWHMRAGHMG